MSVTIGITPFFGFVLALVISGTLVILLAALLWTGRSGDGMRVVELLSAGISLDKARRIFERTAQHRPRIRLTIRQRMRVLDEWPRDETLL